MAPGLTLSTKQGQFTTEEFKAYNALNITKNDISQKLREIRAR